VGCTGVLDLNVEFSPQSSGDFNAIMRINTDENVIDIPLTGFATGCEDAIPSVIGENWSQSQNTIYTYTADGQELLTISSCHPNNTTDPYQYSYDTYLYVYQSCDAGSLIAENDDVEWENCEYNRAASGVTVVVEAGETIYIAWPLIWPGSAHSEDGFMFTISSGRVPDDIYVDCNSQNVEESGSMENPFKTLEDAISVSSSPDRIWVASGTYQRKLEH